MKVARHATGRQAVVAAIATMDGDDLAGAARRIGAAVAAVLDPVVQRHAGIAERRGRGAMQALELVRPGGLEPDPAAATAIAGRCHAAGVVVLTCGTWSNVIRLLPPLSIEPALLDDGLAVLAEAVEAILG